MRIRMKAITVVVGVLVLAATANANTVASSTMYFGTSGTYTLTDNFDGTYTGVLPMLSTNGGYDIYAQSGATAWFGNDPGSGPVWTSQAIGADHDAWPTWTPDTPDWYQYSLNLYVDSGVQKWAVRNHPAGTAANPWYDETHWGAGGLPAKGVPMSGTMNWATKIATETDTGAYLPGTGTPEIAGGAASKGTTAGAWDMDWSWGSELVPLQYPSFSVCVSPCAGGYQVVMTPVPVPGAVLLGVLGLSVAGVKLRRFA